LNSIKTINQHKGTATTMIVQFSTATLTANQQQEVKLQSNIRIQQATVPAALANMQLMLGQWQ